MNGFEKWWRGWYERRFPALKPAAKYAAADPAPDFAAQFVRPHIIHAPELFECDCGREHLAGWVCASAYRDQL